MPRYLLVAALALVSLGCSCSGGGVAIANPTDHPVAVFVTPEQPDSTDRWCDCPHGYKLTPYRTASTVDPKGLARAEWTPVDTSAFRWDTTGRSPKLKIAVMLAPGTTLRVGEAGYDCSGGIIHQDLPALVEIVDAGQQIRLDPIALKDRARKGTKYMLLYEVPGARADTTS